MKNEFNPKELRNVIRELIVFDMQGFKIFDLIKLAFKRGINLVNDPMISAIISCL